MKTLLLTAAAAAAIATSAHAGTPTIDGTVDASYGAAKSTVAFVPGAPEGNFGAATGGSDAIGYKIFLQSDANFVYGAVQTDAAGGGAKVATFANLYWDVDRANGNGSDIGFELSPGSSDFFIPTLSGTTPKAATPDIVVAASADGDTFEFKIPNYYFTGPLPAADFSLTVGAPNSYLVDQQFAGVGDPVVLRLSQSFGFSVAGGPDYGPDRLGVVTIGGGVPEPASWAMMLLGFVGAGTVLRANRRKSALVA